MNKKLKVMFVGMLIASSLLTGCVDLGRVEAEKNKLAKLSFSLGYRKAHLDVLRFYIQNQRLPELQDMDLDKAWGEIQKLIGEE